MAGRDENGEFCTARAKIYPAGLNDVIARAIRKFACGTFAGCGTSRTLPAEFSQFVVTNFVPLEVVQPDYHG
jgi:hypothetical protein